MRTFDPVQLSSIELFCRAADLGSFTAAAESLGLTPAAVSRSVGRLEARLAVRLFVRSTRSMRLTAEGEIYRQQCQQALDQIADAERVITGQQQEVSGVLRISAPTTYAHYRLINLLPRFSKLYPKIDLDLSISNRNINFIEEGFDIAIRLGEPVDSQLVARRLEDAPLGIFGSPAYLKRAGKPKTLEQLRTHRLIQFVLPSTGRPLDWIIRNQQSDEAFSFKSQYRIYDDVLGCVTWARAGAGLTQIYDFIAEPYLKRGELVEVMPAFRGASRPFSILFPQNRHLPARVRVFVDFMTRELKR